MEINALLDLIFYLEVSNRKLSKEIKLPGIVFLVLEANHLLIQMS